MIQHFLKEIIIMSNIYNKTIFSKRIILIISLLAGLLLLLTGCTNNSKSSSIDSVDSVDKHTIITIKQGEDITINSDDITSSATYYNYEIDGYIIQIFAVKAKDGTVRIAFNTCGVCNPSPNSYFIQKGEYFECQNCGNKFYIDQIGLKATLGCSPIAILDENKNIDGKNIVISSDFIETYKDKFESINIFEN
jgi:hypothetical protein